MGASNVQHLVKHFKDGNMDIANLLAVLSKELPLWYTMSRKFMHTSEKTEEQQLGKL
jgi:hypothetical protein